MATEPLAVEPTVSLGEAHGSVRLPARASKFRRFMAFAGPGALISVGYMDPGNWATDLEAGSRFGYRLLWVILGSSLLAMLLQTLSARLGIVTGYDLAQACRMQFKKPAGVALWIFCEIAIVACDLAEVIGSAVALNLLLGLPLLVGVLITGLDVLALLGLMRFGFRKVEAVVVTLVATVSVCFAAQVFLARPDWPAVALGTITPMLPGAKALAIALGILGATVMPHNLYLHSSIVQTRAYERTPEGIREAIRFNTADTHISLLGAFFVNAAILIVAAATFGAQGRIVEELQDAHALLRPILGAGAATAFAVALLASGQSSTITGTLAGQIVMEGFLCVRMPSWIRRTVTRALAVVPAMAIIVATGGKGTVDLLVLSQVVLSMQLPFAIIPLIRFTSDPALMGKHISPWYMKWPAYFAAALLTALNGYLLFTTIGAVWFAALSLACAAFAAWVTFIYKGKPKPCGCGPA